MTEHNLPNEDDAPWLDCMDGFKQLTKQQVDGVFSPAAQAVYDAVLEICPAPADEIAAAALRAAAEQVENMYCDNDVEDSPGVVFAMRQLMLIADELEGASD